MPGVIVLLSLHWLDGNPRRFRTFVGNRISLILDNLPPVAWHHVPTKENPADCASRGLLPKELLEHELWWQGLPWLHSDPTQWPPQPLSSPLSTPELKEAVCISTIPVPPEWIEERYGSYMKLLNVNAWILRFAFNLKSKLRKRPINSSPFLSAKELQRSEQHLFMRSQDRHFRDERQCLLNEIPLKISSTLLARTPFLGDGGLLLVEGQFSNSPLSQSQKHPPILSGSDHLTKLLFLSIHHSLCHCGPSLLLSHVGTMVHVLGASHLARTTCRSYTTCRRIAAKTEHQQMGQLPSNRVSPSLPFAVTGIDYAGPFTMKKGHTRKPKCTWQSFVCFTTKAAHVEVVSDMTTEAFLACLRRFVSRSSRPKSTRITV